MGLLAPLFLAGLAALSLPILLHLIRRTPRGRQEFSSLMFLSPSPPRLTRRSRIDQWLLLLLRLAALACLALAFARPFLREAATLAFDSLPARKVALLVDTSASMRRGDLWRQALDAAERQLQELGPNDDVALFAYSDRLRTLVDFNKERAESTAMRIDLVRHELKSLEPGWTATDLGLAMTSVAAELDSAIDVEQSPARPELVVIGDFQQGGRIDALQSFDWPAQVRVIAHRVQASAATNATVQPLFDEEQAPGADLRVRVSNAPNSTNDQFFVRWGGAGVSADAKEVAVYVPPGQTRVVRLPHTPDDLLADRILLRGDDHDFDNTHYIVPPRKQVVRLVYAGDDAENDPQGLLYYLRLAVSNDPLRQVEVLTPKDRGLFPAGGPAPQLVVVARELPEAEAEALVGYVEQGGTVWLVTKDRASANLTSRLFDNVAFLPAKPLADDAYLLLGEIDFGHPLFQPFANPRYSDFTRIHFWKRHSVEIGPESAAQVVARFDDGGPAILDCRRGAGRALACLFAWNPDDSQFALSSKFVPFVGGVLDLACGGGESLVSVVVRETVTFPPAARGEQKIVVTAPDGREISVAGDKAAFDETNEPGIYRAKRGHDEFHFAVNLPPAESRTAPLDLEQLEQWGVRFGAQQTKAERLTRERQQRDAELESRQQNWRWLIVGALTLLVLETWLAGRNARRIAQATEVVA